jgi:hypothetical protein
MKKMSPKSAYIQGKHFFVTLPKFEVDQEEVSRLKTAVFQAIILREAQTLEHLGVVREAHKDGSFHLHVYLQYYNRRRFSFKHFDYLPKHPNIQTVRGLKAVLDYLVKEDPKPLFSKGFNPQTVSYCHRMEVAPFSLLSEAMQKDPLHFRPWQWIESNKLHDATSKGNWPKALSQLKIRQQVLANNILRSRVGIQLITRQLIEASLSPQEVVLYDSWHGYQVIVDHLNQVPIYSYNKPHKLTNLLVVGRPDIGKTALARKIREFVAVYSFGVDNWFPHYENWIYPMILWNQFNLRAIPYGQLLNVFEGEPTDLPYKGGSTLKQDNQLIYITSNMTLERHICSRFRDPGARVLARANLRARITQILVPEDKDLFLLLKLIRPDLSSV